MPKTNAQGYAIVDHGGYQYRVEAGQELKVPYAAGDPGANLLLDRVLLLYDGNATHFGNPEVEGAVVDATVLSHGREPKVTVFKFRRRKGYRRKRGHRQQYSVLRINGIRIEKARAAPKPAADKAEAATERAGPSKTAAKKPAPKKAPATGTTKKAATPKKSTPVKKTGETTKSATTKTGMKKKSSD